MDRLKSRVRHPVGIGHRRPTSDHPQMQKPAHRSPVPSRSRAVRIQAEKAGVPRIVREHLNRPPVRGALGDANWRREAHHSIALTRVAATVMSRPMAPGRYPLRVARSHCRGERQLLQHVVVLEAPCPAPPRARRARVNVTACRRRLKVKAEVRGGTAPRGGGMRHGHQGEQRDSHSAILGRGK